MPETILGLHLLVTPELRGFLIDHGLDPVTPSFERFFGVLAPYGEDVHSAAPFEASFTFTVDDDSITLTVDGDMDVVDATRSDRN
ncbi:hypothetical protein BRD00_08345 [Halobacteriales archaeon QS_8_69_26]|nr:MAG: hypothetical protein BRD00_08345 [Halobacteriales archaeon QS_8_69_26]